MGKILAIAVNTFREAVRNRILYVILVFALLLLIFSGVLRNFTIASHDRVIQDFGMATINFFGLLISVFVGITLIYNEMEKKTIYTIVSKPIDRHQFLLGKYFGLLLTIYVNVLIMALFFLIAMHWQHLTDIDVMREALWTTDAAGKDVMRMSVPAYYAWAALLSAIEALGSFIGVYTPEYVRELMLTTWLTCLELAVVTAFALLYSTFSSPTLSALFTVLTFIIGRLGEDIYRFAMMLVTKAEGMQNLSGTQKVYYWLALAVSHVAPNLSLFNYRYEAIYPKEMAQTPVPVFHSSLLYTVLYGVMYSAFVISLAVMIFRRRNFK